MNKKKVNEIISTVESLAFWYKNLKVAINQDDKIEIERSDKNIRFIFQLLDELNLTFRTQNIILSELKNNNDIYIKDLIKSTTFYFKDFKIEGSELLAYN